MQKKTDGIGDFSMQEAMQLAQSNAGKQLFAFLQNTQGDKLQNAMDQAAAGDLSQVKKTMEELMASPQAQALLQKLRGHGNG